MSVVGCNGNIATSNNEETPTVATALASSTVGEETMIEGKILTVMES